jgi:replicative DNA helicase
MKTKIEVLDTLIQDIQKRTGTPKMPTGIEALDTLTWGVHTGELMVIAGRPSHGKTSLLLNMAWGLAKNGVPTIVDSLEMSVSAILERLLCIEFGIHGWRLRTGDMNEIKKAEGSHMKMNSRLLSAPIEIFDNVGKSIESVEKQLNEMKPSALFIDYAQKISKKGYSSKYEALSEYVVRLQSLAIEHNCAIVLASQISRGGSKLEDATDYMKGSGEIEESADCLLQCEWPYRNKPETADPKEYIIRATKQRHGPCSYSILNFDAGTFRIYSKTELQNTSGDWMSKVKISP